MQFILYKYLNRIFFVKTVSVSVVIFPNKLASQFIKRRSFGHNNFHGKSNFCKFSEIPRKTTSHIQKNHGPALFPTLAQIVFMEIFVSL